MNPGITSTKQVQPRLLKQGNDPLTGIGRGLTIGLVYIWDQIITELSARLTDMLHGLHVVQYPMAQIVRQNGALSIQALSDYICNNQNHLGTKFKRMVGV